MITVTKASGEQEPYSEIKLRRSLAKAGADKQLIDRIAATVERELFDGITTTQVYNKAFKLLKDSSVGSAGRYKLKKAILELGPTGYPFEKFIGELLNRLGFTTKVGVVIKGNCVSHEVDVVAEKDDKLFMVECKFHNRKGHRCNVKTPLYIQSRFKDVEKTWSSQPGHEHKLHQGWVVTNTRFTTDAQQYGTCAGLKLLSWDFPKKSGLKDLISQVNLYPVTSLTSLSRKEKQLLLEHDIIVCKQLSENKAVLCQLGWNTRKKNRVLKEVDAICG